jgi:ribbon-helix-helix protein, copG family
MKKTNTAITPAFSGRKGRYLATRVDPKLYELIQLKSKEQRLSISDIIRDALALYVTQEVNDKNLIYDAILQMKSLLYFLEKKVDFHRELWFYSLIPQFANYVDYFDKTAEEKKQIGSIAVKRRNELLKSFTNKMYLKPSVIENFLQDFLEQTNQEA